MIAYKNKISDIEKIGFNTFKSLHKELVSLEANTPASITDLYVQVDDNIYHASIFIDDNNMYIKELEVSDLCQ